MPWFKHSDTWWRNPKVRRASRDARSLWAMAGSWCADALTDGVVPAEALPMLDATVEHAEDLVRVGLFQPVTGADGAVTGWRMASYGTHNPSKGEVLADRQLRTACRLRPRLRQEVRARDGDGCRYCGRHVVWSDRRSRGGGTYDVVDPAEVVDVENLVVACRGCATEKAGRGLDDAGMRLGPIRTAPVRQLRGSPQRPGPGPRSDHRSDPDHTQDRPGSVPRSVPESDLGTHQPPYPVPSPSPRRGGDGDGRETPGGRAAHVQPAPTPAGGDGGPSPERTSAAEAAAVEARAALADVARRLDRPLLSRTYTPIRRHGAVSPAAPVTPEARPVVTSLPRPDPEPATPAAAPQVAAMSGRQAARIALARGVAHLHLAPPARARRRLRRGELRPGPWRQLALRLWAEPVPEVLTEDRWPATPARSAPAAATA